MTCIQQVNTLSEDVQKEFAEVFQQAVSNNEVKSMVVISGKPDCFIAGADIG